MKRFLYSLLCTLLCVAANAQFDSAPAFPGAEGYGRYTTGGRGGTVYHVTTLEDYCDDKDYTVGGTDAEKGAAIPGSLRYAIKQDGPRIIVFDVAGTIELKAPLKIQKDDITILGQTAPGDGICLKNYTLGIFANNVIVRYIRCRLGNDGRRYWGKDDKGNRVQYTELKDQIFEDDAMNGYQKDGANKKNIIIDHCSISWSVDECASFYGNQEFSMQWCIISESLKNAGHAKGNHGYGGIWGGEKASFHHNLLADHDSRNPRFDHGYVSTLAGPVDYTNNVLYNWGGNSAYGGENKPGYEAKKFNMINNYYRYGGATSDKDRLLNPTTYCKNCNSSNGADIVPGKFYISGNYMYGSNTVTNDNTCSSAIVMDSDGMTYSNWKSGNVSSTKFKASDAKFNYNTISLHTAEVTYDKVAQYAGASLSRDAIDTRLGNEAKSGNSQYYGSKTSKQGIIDQPSDVGGYPTLTGTMATDTDGDGIPDEWEDAHNLDKNDASDALTYTLDTKHGYYTNLEVYANYLVQHITKAERAGATETFEEYYPLDSNDPAPTQTVITASSESVNITGTANTTVTLSSNNTAGAYSITTQPDASVATASISGNTITITGVTAGTTSLTVTQAATTGYTSATKTINITVSAQGGDTPTEGTLIWDYTSTAPSSSPDNGLYFGGKVDDTGNTSYNGLKGIKLDSSGYCYFDKGNVAGTLSITYGPRGGDSSLTLNVYNTTTATSSTDGATLIKTTEGHTSNTTSSVELTADQRYILITRGNSVQGVITKIVFTPTTPDHDATYDKNLGNNTYVVAEGDKAVSGTQIKGTDITMTYGTDDTWKEAATESTKPNGYTYYITSNTNPSPNNGSVPTSGCYYKFEPTASGTLDVAMLVNSGRNLYVVENGTSIGYKIGSTSYTAGSSLSAKTGDILSFPVTAGKTYYVYAAGSKLGIFGWTFTEGSGDDDPSTPTTVDGTETTPTAKTSNTDFVGLCYTIPATYVGGQGNSSKAIKFNLRDDKIVINVNPNYTITGFTFTGNDNYADNGITINSVTVDGGSTNVLGSNVTFATDKSENSFTVSNINATQNITITAATPHDNQLNGTIVFTYKYNVQPLALQSSAKTSSRNGSVTLKFNNPMAAVNGTATLNGKTLTADADGTSLKFVYTGLDYGQTYTFTVPAGALKDEFDQTYDQPINIPVTTDARATVTKKGFDKIVSNGEELAAAIAEANNHGTERYRIFVKKGAHILPTNGTTKGTDGATYPDPRTHLSGANVSIIGEDYATTSFTNITPAPVNNACPLEGIGNGDVLIIDKTATESYFQGVTIRTSMGDAHGRDIAVNDQSNKTIMKDVCLWGYQDTYVSNNSNGRFYFDGGVLRGRTDYLCGKGDVYYNKVTLQQVGTGGYLAVPSVPLKYGYIFNECYIKKETNDVTYYLGRPWGSGTPIALFINTKVDAAPITDGWAEMSNGWPDRFAEYGTKTTSGSAVSTSGRKTTFASTHSNNPVLTAAEAEYYSNMARIMGGTDGWDPTEYTEQCAMPTAQLSGSTLTWNDDSYASSWIVFKDGKYYANPITNSLVLTESGTYTVRAANAMGGLGEASTGVNYTDMSAGGAVLAFTASVQGGSNAAGSFVNQETHHYNYFGTSGWVAQAYIGFNVAVPAGKQIKSATLKFTSQASGGNSSQYVANAYLLTKAQANNFNENNLSLSGTLGTQVGEWYDKKLVYSLVSLDINKDVINDVVTPGTTSKVIFQIGNAQAGGDLYGYTSTKTPTLVVEFEDIPTPAVTSVIVSPANKTIEVGETLQLSAQLLPAGANQNVTWSSSDNTKAEVSASGLVTAKATGPVPVKITATAADDSGKSDFCMVTIVEKWSGGSGNATFYPTDFSSKTGSTTKEGVTLTLKVEGYNDSSHGNTMKCKSDGNTLTFSSSNDITSIVVNCNLTYSTNMSKIKATANVGGVVKNTSDYTWTGNAKNIVLTFGLEDGQSENQSVYVSSIDVVTASAPATEYITKHIAASTWASFVPEKPVEVPEDVRVYYIKRGSYNSSAKTVQAIQIATGTVIKGDDTNTYGYIINADKEGDYKFKVSSIDIQTYNDNILACGKNIPIDEGSLVFGRINGISGFYGLNSYVVNVPFGITYLPVSVLTFGGSAAPASVGIVFNDEEEVTGILLENEANRNRDNIFNINGQKVDSNFKGIVIKNGRKYIRK